MESFDNVALLELFTRLDDKTLAKFCSTNSTYRHFCNTSSILWKNRLLKYLGKYYSKIDSNKNVLDIIEDYKERSKLNWRDYYITTMSMLDDIFIRLMDIPTDREDILKLIEIMEKEPFSLYYKHLYENVPIDEKIYDNLDETDKRWLSPGVMFFHILIGNIRKEENIREIINSHRIIIDDIDVVFNTLFRHYNYNVIGIRYILQYYEQLEPQLNGRNKEIAQRAIKDLRHALKTSLVLQQSYLRN